MLARKHSQLILALITATALVAMLFMAPIPQDPAYHHFADTRNILGIPNFWNFLSNLPFLVVGIYGLLRARHLAEARSRNGYLALCIGVMLVSAGSSYYHYAPSTSSLVWDRLPMTIAFMALFSLLIDERVLPGRKSRTLAPLIVLGMGSVAYWYWTESHGAGDLRAYALVQFLPVVLIPVILALFKPDYLSGALLLSALVLYFVAKAFEQFDQQIFDVLGFISGHAIKHAVAAVAVWLIIQAVPVHRHQR